MFRSQLYVLKIIFNFVSSYSVFRVIADNFTSTCFSRYPVYLVYRNLWYNRKLFVDLTFVLDEINSEQIQIPHLAARMMKMHNNIFTKFDEMMGRCKNGDQSNSIHQMSSDFDLRWLQIKR